jgi:quinol monooxygenase YgiN
MTATRKDAGQASGPLVRIAQIEVDPAQLDGYRAASRAIVEASVAEEPGVLAFYAVEPNGIPGQVWVMEIYRCEAAYRAHLETPHFKTYKAAVAAMVNSLRLVETTLIAFGAKAT